MTINPFDDAYHGDLVKRIIEYFGLCFDTGNAAKYILRAGAKIHFLSCEPLLERLDLGGNIHGIDWVIIGGESGPNSRPMHPDWARNLRNQCNYHDTAFLFKQWGGVNKKATGRELDGRTWDGFPEVS